MKATKKFESLGAKECLEVYKHIHHNADEVLKSAKLIAGQQQFGLARSLLILGAEEFIKGTLIFMKGVGVRVNDIPEVRKALNQYKERHEVAVFYNLVGILIVIGEAVEKEIEPTFKNKWANGAWVWLNRIASLSEPFNTVTKKNGWWLKANNFKNEGIYVDYLNELKLPQYVTEEEYGEALFYVKELRVVVGRLIDTFQNQPKPMQQKMVKEINGILKFYTTGELDKLKGFM